MPYHKSVSRDPRFTNLISQKHSAMADECRALYGVVSAMLELYDDDLLNDTQPDSFPRIIPHSLDEWASEILLCVDEWEASALAFENCVTDKQRDIDEQAARALCEAAGFAVEMGGGGCLFMARYHPSGAHSYITCDEGGGMPTESDFMACYYPKGWDGEEVQAAIRSGGSVTLTRAIATVAALVEAGR